MGSGGMVPHILNLCTRWRWVVSFTPRLLYYPEQKTLKPTGQEAGWILEPIWTRWRREKIPFHVPARNRTPVVQPVSLVTILTELSWILCVFLVVHLMVVRQIDSQSVYMHMKSMSHRFITEWPGALKGTLRWLKDERPARTEVAVQFQTFRCRLELLCMDTETGKPKQPFQGS
jgi:hypothetical protein